MKTTIRPCMDADLEALHGLYQQLHFGEITSTPEELDRSFRAMKNHPGCEIYAAETDGKVVGTFVLYFLPNMTRNGRPAAILENIVVDESCRGQGIGRAMLEYARELAIAGGCYKLSLTSNAVREEAHSFYERCGMVRHGYSFRYAL